MNLLFRLKKTVLDCLFPTNCLGCGREGKWVCSDCYLGIEIDGVFLCPVCRKHTESGVVCGDCVQNSFLSSHIAVVLYREDKLIGKIVHSWKYRYAEELKDVLEELIGDFIVDKDYLFSDIDYIIPIPLHKKRLAERGFNQAQILADILGQELGRPVSEVLEREQYTVQQARLDKGQREKNVRSAFVSVSHVSGNILLVDDVFTTGSTMQEAAKVLLESGAEKVRGFSLARGVWVDKTL